MDKDKYLMTLATQEKVTLKEFITVIGAKPSTSYTGQVMKEDYVIAFDTTEEQNAELLEFHVLQQQLTELNPSYSPSTVTKSYFYRPDSTTKTGTGVSIALTGDVYAGDFVQEFLIEKKYKTGKDVIVRYLIMNMKTGKGETAFATCTVDSDRGGAVRENATFSVTLQSTGNTPTEFIYEELLIEAGEITQEDVTTSAFQIAAGNDTVKVTLKKGTFHTSKTNTSLYNVSGETVESVAFENSNKTLVLTIVAADAQNNNATVNITAEAFTEDTVVTNADVETPIASTKEEELSALSFTKRAKNKKDGEIE